MMKTLPNDRHEETKSFLRVLGPAFLVIGLILSIIGIGSFLNAFIGLASDNHQPGETGFPLLFLLAFPGFILLGIGATMTQIGYLKEITKYAAKETTPAATIASTAIRAAIKDDDIPCPACSEPIEPHSKFCAHCGIQTQDLTCTKCNTQLEPNDRFCNQCGHSQLHQS